MPARLRRSAPPLAACAVAAGALAWLAFRQGGYFEDDRLTAAVGAWLALGVLCAVEFPRLRLGSPALVALAALGLFTAWTALSTGWSADAVRGTRLAELDVLYVALFAIGIVAAGSGRHARTLLLSVLGVGTLVLGAALWARLHPGAFGSPAPASVPGYRMDWPFGYWNGLGGLGAMTGVLAIGYAADPRSHPVLRSAAASASVLCLVATYLTFSRGSVVALAVGLVVLVLLGVHRASLVASLVVVGVAVAVLVLRLEGGLPALTTDPTGDVAGAGRAFLPVLLVVLAAAAGAQAVLTVGNRSVAVADLVRRARVPVAIGLGAVVVVGAFGAYVVKADAIEGRTAQAVDDTHDWIDRQWDEFNRPGIPTEQERGSARLDSAAGTRSDLWSVAKHGFTARPLQGQGAGSYQVLFFRDRKVDESVQNAHSLPYETLAELGLVGFGLLLAFLGAIVAACARSRKRKLALPTTQTAAAGAAVSVWLVHACVDWDWQLPAFTGLALLAAATLFPSGSKRRRSSAT